MPDKEKEHTEFSDEQIEELNEWLGNGVCYDSALVLIGVKPSRHMQCGAADGPLLWEETNTPRVKYKVDENRVRLDRLYDNTVWDTDNIGIDDD